VLPLPTQKTKKTFVVAIVSCSTEQIIGMMFLFLQLF